MCFDHVMSHGIDLQNVKFISERITSDTSAISFLTLVTFVLPCSEQLESRVATETEVKVQVSERCLYQVQ